MRTHASTPPDALVCVLVYNRAHRHPSVITFHGVYEDVSDVYMVMELCTGGWVGRVGGWVGAALGIVVVAMGMQV